MRQNEIPKKGIHTPSAFSDGGGGPAAAGHLQSKVLPPYPVQIAGRKCALGAAPMAPAHLQLGERHIAGELVLILQSLGRCRVD